MNMTGSEDLDPETVDQMLRVTLVTEKVKMSYN